jgi:hypothetical protein
LPVKRNPAACCCVESPFLTVVSKGLLYLLAIAWIVTSAFAEDRPQNQETTKRGDKAADSAFSTFNGLFHFLVQAADWKIETHEITNDFNNLRSGEVFVVKRLLGASDSPVVWIRSSREPVNLLDMADVAAATHPPSDGWKLEGKLTPAQPDQPFCLVFVKESGGANEEKNLVLALGNEAGSTQVTVVMKPRRLTADDKLAMQRLFNGFNWMH